MPSNRGDATQAFDDAAIKVAADYTFPAHHHNPMEMHGTTVVWSEDGVDHSYYDKTQGSQNVQAYLAGVFGLSKDKVTVRNPYVGGAFGSGLRPQYQVYLATMAALHLKRSVRVTMTRQQMVSHVHRPELFQSVSLATERGRRSAGNHQSGDHGDVLLRGLHGKRRQLGADRRTDVRTRRANTRWSRSTRRLPVTCARQALPLA